ncbi:hypothetical protein AAC387_Pa09g0168 [Persea americana]
MESTQKFFLVSCICLCFLTPCTREEWIVSHIKHPHLYVQSHTAMPPSLPADLVKPSISLLPGPAMSLSNSTRIFNVQSFGAVGDTVTDDTQAFKSAWEMACQVKSAILLVPHGYSFMIQPMIFAGPCRNGLTFQVNGVLMPPDLLDSWPKNNSRQQWLVFYRMEGMSLQGGGTIDGKGEKWWNLPYKPHKGINGATLPGSCDNPVAIRFFMSSNLTLSKD